jgi:hypothetical protein
MTQASDEPIKYLALQARALADQAARESDYRRRRRLEQAALAHRRAARRQAAASLEDRRP